MGNLKGEIDSRIHFSSKFHLTSIGRRLTGPPQISPLVDDVAKSSRGERGGIALALAFQSSLSFKRSSETGQSLQNADAQSQMIAVTE